MALRIFFDPRSFFMRQHLNYGLCAAFERLPKKAGERDALTGLSLSLDRYLISVRTRSSLERWLFRPDSGEAIRIGITLNPVEPVALCLVILESFLILLRRQVVFGRPL